MERRDFFSMLAAGTGALGGSLLDPSPAEANWGMVAPGPVPPTGFDGRALVNKARAYEVMEREGVDGIVALNPVNVFYLGNYFSYELQKLRAIPSFAVMPRDPNLPSFLVAAGTDLMFLANGDREVPEIVPYSFPVELEKYLEGGDWSVEPKAGPVGAWPKGKNPLSEREKVWVDFGARANERRAATPEWALVRALELAGLSKGKIAVDDMRIAHVLDTLGRKGVTCVPGDNTFRKIRMVKSEVELGHMRTIARINQDACMAMLRQIGKGATKDDIDELFMAEAAKRGAKAMWIATGTIGGLIHGEVVEGEPMMIDSVCQRNFYHGDFGRTAVLGEPTKEIKACMAAMKIGMETARATIKPGVKYSQLRKAVVEAQQKAYTGNSGIKFAAAPHTVGLQHTDQAYRDGLPFVVAEDHTFEEGMTLTVDQPTSLLGWGWIHCEDLLVVTKTGVEPLATADGPLVIL
ncbi:MAG: aminopeptidase P family protein [Rhodobacteraceae bacterium]|nr:aminopeptidase P family protein [Paracoccaceae bacterium]